MTDVQNTTDTSAAPILSDPEAAKQGHKDAHGNRRLADNIEIRHFKLELRQEEDAAKKKPRLIGYASVFDTYSEDMWGFREKVAKGAFDKTLKEHDIRMFWNHDSNIVLGRNKNGTLTLTEDDRGLAVDNEPPDNQLIRDMVLGPIERGDVDQMSFAFDVIRDQWDYDRAADVVTRTLVEVRLYEVSPVAIPAYPDTVISARAKNRAAELRSAPFAAPAIGHPATEQAASTPEPDHPEKSAPVEGDHLDTERRMRLEAAARAIRLSVA